MNLDHKTYKASVDIADSVLPDGLALLDMQAGKFYSLDFVGAFIWELIKAPSTFDAIIGGVTENFDVSADLCRDDIAALLDSLAASGLVEVSVARGFS